MISKKMQEAINEQIKYELQSAYLYLSMAAYFTSSSLDGMAHWMQLQAQEEVSHAMKFYNHVLERDGKVNLLTIEQPKSEWATPLEVFQQAYEHEKFVSSRINTLVDIATKEMDNPATVILQWFVTEQVEEEATASKIVQMLERIGDSGNGLFMLDMELGKRIMPTGTEEK